MQEVEAAEGVLRLRDNATQQQAPPSFRSGTWPGIPDPEIMGTGLVLNNSCPYFQQEQSIGNLSP